MFKTTHIDLVPNFEADDIKIIKRIFWGNTQEGRYAREWCEHELQKYAPGHYFFFTSAREALHAFLKFYLAQGTRKKVLTQGFSCLVVPNSIKWAGGTPVFVDVEKNDINMSAIDLEKKADAECGVLLVQNTFGIPADYDALLSVAKKKNLFVIENLAHALGARYDNKYLGQFGDAALLSFGRAKVISSLAGGALVIKNKKLADAFAQQYAMLRSPSFFWKKRVVCYFLAVQSARQHFDTWGKILMHLMQKTGFMFLEIEPCERKGIIPKRFGKKMPGEFFLLLQNQLKKLDRMNNHRREIAHFYRQAGLLPAARIDKKSDPIFLRYPLYGTHPHTMLALLKTHAVYGGNWYVSALAPAEKRLDIFGYYYGACPHAEKQAMGSYNLPTAIGVLQKDASYIAELIINAYL